MKLWPAEIDRHADGSCTAGCIVQFPSGLTLQVAWRTKEQIQPTLEAAKKYTSQLLDSLLKANLQDDADRTNWPSAVAAVQKVIADFNMRLIADSVVHHEQSTLHS